MSDTLVFGPNSKLSGLPSLVFVCVVASFAWLNGVHGGTVMYEDGKILGSRPGGYWTDSLAFDGDRLAGGFTDRFSLDWPLGMTFTRQGDAWTASAPLTPDGDLNNGFQAGFGIGIDGTTAVLTGTSQISDGVRDDTPFVFEWDGTSWVQTARLASHDQQMGDWLGSGVAISGDRIIAGAYGDDGVGDIGNRTGTAYIFERTDGAWQEVAKLDPDDLERGSHFGWDVAIDGNTAIVGAHERGGNLRADGEGKAYVYEFDGVDWQQVARIDAEREWQSWHNHGSSGDQFGRAVAIDGDTIVVGAPKGGDLEERWSETPEHYRTGAAYVFQRTDDGWQRTAELFADDGATNDIFGDSVAISGNTIVVGAMYDDFADEVDGEPTDDDTGSAYVFRNDGDGWYQLAKLLASDHMRKDIFGVSVAIDGDTVLVGASGDDNLAGGSAGAVYVYTLPVTIPEPSTFFLLLLGAASVLICRRYLAGGLGR